MEVAFLSLSRQLSTAPSNFNQRGFGSAGEDIAGKAAGAYGSVSSSALWFWFVLPGANDLPSPPKVRSI
jgi:hypothetical protein